MFDADVISVRYEIARFVLVADIGLGNATATACRDDGLVINLLENVAE